MLNKNSLIVFFLLLLTLSACAAPGTSAPTVIVEPTGQPAAGLPQTEADVPRVTVEEAAAAFASGDALIVDVRIAESFTAGHIKGAFSIPLAEIEANPSGVNLDKTRWIITYCT